MAKKLLKDSKSAPKSKVCFVFGMHMPFILKEYSFYQIGNDSRYYSDEASFFALQQVARRSYLPALKLLEQLLVNKQLGFKFTLAPSGSLLDQLQLYVPEVLNTLRRLVVLNPNLTELAATPYFYALAQHNQTEWERQLQANINRLKVVFAQDVNTYVPPFLFHKPELNPVLAQLGIKSVVVEGAALLSQHQQANNQPEIANDVVNLLPRHTALSDDISVRFADKNWNHAPLTAEKYFNWLLDEAATKQQITIFLDLRALGDFNQADTQIFTFFEKLIRLIAQSNQIEFDLLRNMHPLAAQNDEKTTWQLNTETGYQGLQLSNFTSNNLQSDALSAFLALGPQVAQANNPALLNQWARLADATYFGKMSVNHQHLIKQQVMDGPNLNAYDVFIGYMNILKDFAGRV